MGGTDGRQQAGRSPDGKRLVFEVQNLSTADPPNRRAIFIVNVDGSGLRQLTDWSLNGGDHPDWSPDGKRILLLRAVSDWARGIAAISIRSRPTAASSRS